MIEHVFGVILGISLGLVTVGILMFIGEQIKRWIWGK